MSDLGEFPQADGRLVRPFTEDPKYAAYTRPGETSNVYWLSARPMADVVFWKPSEKSHWTMSFCGNIHWTPEKGREPNWFHRFMQELCFGVKWSKR